MFGVAMCGRTAEEHKARSPPATMKILYFGCYKSIGHGLYAKNDKGLLLTGQDAPRWNSTGFGDTIDTGLLEEYHTSYREGFVCYQTGIKLVWYCLWDNSIDSRPGSHSTFVTEGIYTKEELLEEAKKQWPEVFAHFWFEVTL